jgi:RibD C-terminal domain
MRIKTHHSLTLDGFSATPDGMPAITLVTEFRPKEHPRVRRDVRRRGDGPTTFEPAATNPWCRGGSARPRADLPRTPGCQPARRRPGDRRPEALVQQLRSDDIDGDVELLGGPTLSRALWQRGQIDQLGLLVLPILIGTGLPLFPLDAAGVSTPLTLVARAEHPDGAGRAVLRAGELRPGPHPGGPSHASPGGRAATAGGRAARSAPRTWCGRAW